MKQQEFETNLVTLYALAKRMRKVFVAPVSGIALVRENLAPSPKSKKPNGRS
jgi:hypothetical protein